jgi:hypothetical protein
MPQKSVLTEAIGDYFWKSNLETLIYKTSQLSIFFPRILFTGSTGLFFPFYLFTNASFPSFFSFTPPDFYTYS